MREHAGGCAARPLFAPVARHRLWLGRLDAAKAEVRAALPDEPAFTRALWREGSFYSDPDVLDGELADLTAAALPEK